VIKLIVVIKRNAAGARDCEIRARPVRGGRYLLACRMSRFKAIDASPIPHSPAYLHRPSFHPTNATITAKIPAVLGPEIPEQPGRQIDEGRQHQVARPSPGVRPVAPEKVRVINQARQKATALARRGRIVSSDRTTSISLNGNSPPPMRGHTKHGQR